MSLAAEIAATVKGHSENGPVTHAAAHGSAASRSSQVTRPQQRTADELDEVGPVARFLEVFEEVAPAGSLHSCGTNLSLALRTEFEGASRMRGLAREGRKNAARKVWMFEHILTRTIKGGHLRHCGTSQRREGGVVNLFGAAA